ncbi:MAG: metallophosphoesterase [Vicingaceae bacterium]
MSTVRHLNISKPTGRRLAISDIHGCSKTFKALLEQIKLQREDHLYLLGDLVNRGPSTDKVIDLVLELQTQGYQIFVLRGNHEQLLLNASEKPKRLNKVLPESNASAMLKGNVLKKRYSQFLAESYHYFTLEDYYLVHAGFDFSKELPFENTHSMLHIKDFKAKRKFLSGRKIVVGHSPQPLQNIMKRIQKGKRKLYIDNGCLNKQLKGQGNLVCLNLDSMALSIQCNLDT